MIVKQQRIKIKDDIFDLDIIDFNRLNGAFAGPLDALNTIYSWFKPGAVVTVVDFSEFFWKIRKRNDFPGWKHVGGHVEIGEQYWNFFYNCFDINEGTWLQFSDSPDFFGAINNVPFWGDIGKVSASAFAISQKQMKRGSLWITLKNDGNIHILIEPLYDISEAFENMINNMPEPKPLKAVHQLSFW